MLAPLRSSGQALTESILLMPLFLFFVFALLQLSQIGVAIVLSQYAASSVARRLASGQSFGSGSNPVIDANNRQKILSLMQVGMQFDDAQACIVPSGGGSDPTGEMIVAVRAKLEAWPFFSTIMDQITQNSYSAGPISCGSMDNPGGMGPVNYTGQASPSYFYVTGKAKVRLNYIS